MTELPRPAPAHGRRRKHILPGFGLTLGFSIFYLTGLILLPLLALALRTVTPTADYPTVGAVVGHVWQTVTAARAVATYQLSFGLSFAAALIDGFFGLIAAWALTRYQFPGRKIADALVDLPFAMPTSVAGLALTQMFAPNGGWLGRYVPAAYTAWGILIALVFVGFPFVVRTLQPVMAGLRIEAEEAAACLGANRWQIFRRVLLPALRPAMITGAMLAFGRAVGEYGSVVFISGGNMPYRTEITPHLIIIRLEEFDYAGAAGLGLVMLLVSFAIVVTVNLVQHFTAPRGRTA